MQITVTVEQEHLILTIIQVVVIPFCLWMFKAMLAGSRRVLNQMITDNVNRSANEQREYMDRRFQEHLECDREQFDALRTAMNLPKSGL